MASEAVPVRRTVCLSLCARLEEESWRVGDKKAASGESDAAFWLNSGDECHVQV